MPFLTQPVVVSAQPGEHMASAARDRSFRLPSRQAYGRSVQVVRVVEHFARAKGNTADAGLLPGTGQSTHARDLPGGMQGAAGDLHPALAEDVLCGDGLVDEHDRTPDATDRVHGLAGVPRYGAASCRGADLRP